jgi:hypothetical protein
MYLPDSSSSLLMQKRTLRQQEQPASAKCISHASVVACLCKAILSYSKSSLLLPNASLGISNSLIMQNMTLRQQEQPAPPNYVSHASVAACLCEARLSDSKSSLLLPNVSLGISNNLFLQNNSLIQQEQPAPANYVSHASVAACLCKARLSDSKSSLLLPDGYLGISNSLFMQNRTLIQQEQPAPANYVS